MTKTGVGNLAPAEIAKRAEQLGARVEFAGFKYKIFPADPSQRPIFFADRFTNGADRSNVLARLRRAGLDVTAEPISEEKSAMPVAAATPAAMPERKPVAVAARQPATVTFLPTVGELHEQVKTMFEMLAEAESRVDANAAETAKLRTELDALRAANAEQRKRITALERRVAGGGAAPKDPNAELDAAILAFMRATPVKLTAAVIAANIDVETSGNMVGKRLQALAGAGKIEVCSDPADKRRVYRMPVETHHDAA